MPSLALVVAVVSAALLAVTMAVLLLSRRRLAAKAALYSGFLEHGPFLAYLKDAAGRYVYENEAVLAHVNRVQPGTTTALGRTDRELFPSVSTLYVDHDREVIEHGTPHQFAEMSVDADGTVRHWSSMKFPWRDELGNPGVAGISIDVTDLRRARTDAQSSEERCALALEAGCMGTFTMDLATQMLDTSPLFATLHGRPETTTRISLEEALAEVHPDDRPKILGAVQAALHDRAPSRITYRVVLPDGGIRWVELMGRVFADDAGRPAIVHGVGFDISEERAAYEELARRKTILRRLIEVQENERQTLCHELHDGLIQYAIGAKMQLDSARDEEDPALRAERIDAALVCLERGIAEGRQVIRGVRPAVLDDLGLAAAIEDLAEQLAAGGVIVESSLDEGLDAVPPQFCTTIYRVVQEALTNVRKHAGTDRATVEVRRVGDDVHVRIRDHGPGFDVEEARARGFGLVGMTERVRLAGGTLWIESGPAAGTQVNARLPVPKADADGGDGTIAYAAATPGLLAR
ncbi:MAG: PAS domain-containing protein [Planctomycetaceae bacterium]